MNEAEQILYDRTGMLGSNHPSIIEAMDEYAKQQSKKAVTVSDEYIDHYAQQVFENIDNRDIHYSAKNQNNMSGAQFVAYGMKHMRDELTKQQ